MAVLLRADQGPEKYNIGDAGRMERSYAMKQNMHAFAGPFDGFALGLGALLLFAVGSFSTAASADAVMVRASDAGKTVLLHVGEQLTVQLHAQPGTGFRWAPAATSTSLLSLSSTTQGRASMPGALESQSLTFIARSAGEGNLNLTYRRTWEKEMVPAKSFSIAVKITAPPPAIGGGKQPRQPRP